LARCGFLKHPPVEGTSATVKRGKPVVQHETIHNRGRKRAGPPPIEGWMSWVDPKTPEPDFHVPSSLGRLEIVE
jgi:hypothetical protein